MQNNFMVMLKPQISIIQQSFMRPFCICLFAGIPLLSSATTISSDVVGYVKTTVKSHSDLNISVPFVKEIFPSSKISQVTKGEILLSHTVGNIEAGKYFIHLTTGALAGQWFTIIYSTANTIEVAEDIEQMGALVDDEFSILPFWTIDTLFPDGGNIPKSSNVYLPTSQLLTYNVNADGINISPSNAYIYHSGEQGTAGWYDMNNLSDLKGATILHPGSYITIRNTEDYDINITLAGVVQMNAFANLVKSSSSYTQDNLIPYPYPSAITLGESDLIENEIIRASPNVFLPTDQLLIHNLSNTGYNQAPSTAIIYHDGTQGLAGWYDMNNLGGGPIDNYVIEPLSTLIIRRQTGDDELLIWKPTPPYTN
jgi:uncharacterized protein (TIGR02597 family)